MGALWEMGWARSGAEGMHTQGVHKGLVCVNNSMQT